MRAALASIPRRELVGIATGFLMALAGLGIAFCQLAAALPPIGVPS